MSYFLVLTYSYYYVIYTYKNQNSMYLNRPIGEESSVEELGNGFFGPEDERKEKCIHCQTEWYAKHHKDGVCNSCQEKKLPGRSALAQKRQQKNIVKLLVIIGLIIIAIKYLWNLL